MKSIVFLGVLALLAGALPASAAIIYNNGTLDPSVTGWYSDFDQPLQLADNFQLSAGATLVSDVHWWGGYDPQQFAPDNFAVRIFAEDNGNPSATTYSSLTGTITRSATGLTDPDGFGIFAYDMVLDSSIQLQANTTYWLSIVNETDSWFWQPTVDRGDPYYRSNDGDAWIQTDNHDLAFYLTNDVVPEPASLSLLGLGLAGLALRRRKGAK